MYIGFLIHFFWIHTIFIYTFFVHILFHTYFLNFPFLKMLWHSKYIIQFLFCQQFLYSFYYNLLQFIYRTHPKKYYHNLHTLICSIAALSLFHIILYNSSLCNKYYTNKIYFLYKYFIYSQNFLIVAQKPLLIHIAVINLLFDHKVLMTY